MWRVLLPTGLLLLSSIAAAEPSLSCLDQRGPSGFGPLLGIAVLDDIGSQLLAVTGSSIVRSDDGGRSWSQVAVLSAPPSGCGPRVSSRGSTAVVFHGGTLFVTRDLGKTVATMPWPLAEAPCHLALASRATLYATAGPTLAKVTLRGHGSVVERLVPVGGRAGPLTSTGRDLYLVVNDAVLVGPHGQGSLRPATTALPPEARIRALAADQSGDVWVATTSGLFVIGHSSPPTRVTVGAGQRAYSAMAVGSGSRVYLIADGSLQVLRPASHCSSRHELSRLRSRPLRLPRRPFGWSGLLPTMRFRLVFGRGRQGAMISARWPLPRVTTTDLPAHDQLVAFMSSAEQRDAAARHRARARWGGGRRSLSRAWSPHLDSGDLARAVAAMEAAAELELLGAPLP